jgi:tripartite-type tricarboxylate transporter receptor subunit TctC
MLKQSLLAAVAGIAFIHGAGAQAAPAYPVRPITIIVPATAGGTSDFSARVVGQKLAERLGQPVLVDNRPGAGNTIGAAAVARAEPDGYTLLLIDTTIAISPALGQKLPYDTGHAFTHIGLIASAPYVLIANAKSPFKTVADIVEYSKANPGKLSYASGGVGTGPHLAGALLETSAGLQMVHVPYKGAAPAMSDLMGGQVDLMFAGIPTALAQIKAGTITAIATTDGNARSPVLPNVPKVSESGYPDYSVPAWFGLSGPANMPPEVVAKLSLALNDLLKTQDAKDKLLSQGATASPTTPQAFDTFFHQEMARWAKIVAESHIQAN